MKKISPVISVQTKIAAPKFNAPRVGSEGLRGNPVAAAPKVLQPKPKR